MVVAPTVAMGPLADGSISNFACSISNYLYTNFGAFIKKCTIRPKMAAYPLLYIVITTIYYNNYNKLLLVTFYHKPRSLLYR